MDGADAQFAKVRILLPYDDFEDDYQATAGSNMIAFPGGRDAHAAGEVAGYDPDLQLAAPVPYGSRIALGIPVAATEAGQTALYRYCIAFRDRNLADFRNPEPGGSARQPYHYARQGPGADDNSGATPAQRFPIRARYHEIAYEQSEPGATAQALLNIYPEYLVPQRHVYPNALVPGGNTAIIQQGIYDPAVMQTANDIMEPPFWLDAKGDEIIVFAQKIPDQAGVFANWDFDNADIAFSNTFGRGSYTTTTHAVFTDGGIALTTGCNP